MLLLCISDIHSGLESIKSLENKLSGRKIDLIVFCGDFTNTGHLKTAESALRSLQKICPNLLCIPGNQDSEEIIQMLEDESVSIHKQVKQFNNYSFIGLGGGKPVHCFYRINVGELQAKKFYQTNFPKNPEKTIIVSHCPPAGTRLEVADNGLKLGLKALAEIIKEKQPLLCLCGHVHEAKGSEKIGSTPCYNIGPLFEGNALLIKLPKLNVEEVVF